MGKIELIEKQVKEKGHTSLKLSEVKWLIEQVKKVEKLEIRECVDFDDCVRSSC